MTTIQQNDAAAKRVDVLQHALASFPPVECPVVHRFTPGLYSREMLMPAGSCVVGCIHKTEHQFAVLSGLAYVWNGESVELVGHGFVGVTKPGARRVALVVEDFRWVTFHPTTKTSMKDLEDELVEKPDVGYVASDPESQAPLADITRALFGLASIEKKAIT